jgi:protein involved in polysaccharide export with SLBB domain
MPFRAVFVSLAVLLAAVHPGVVTATPYTLVPGDRVTLRLAAQGTSENVTVDVDGQLRIAGAGGIFVAGISLDEAERRMKTALARIGVFVNPDVSLTILSHAPVVIAGDVLGPGQYDYIPGMTIGTALALSGGSRVTGTSRLEVERALLDNKGAMRAINLEIAASVLAITRLDALLNAKDSYGPPSIEAFLNAKDSYEPLFDGAPTDALALIPTRAALPMALLQEAEADLFDTTSTLIVEASAAWDEEIALFEEQLALLDERTAVREDTLILVARDLETARDLSERGLQTVNRLTQAEQRSADARARLLELESTRIVVVQALAEARRGRANFLRNRREEWLMALQDQRVRLQDSQIRYALRLERQFVLSGGASASQLMGGGDLVEFGYRITRAGNVPLPEELTLETPVLPGDLLIVSSRIAPMGGGQ